MKICRVCKENKALADFTKRKDRPDGHATLCRVCSRADINARQKANPERQKARMQAYYEAHKNDPKTPEQKARRAQACKARREANPEKSREACRRWGAANLEKKRAATSNWRKNNLWYGCAQQNAREAAKLQAIPRWADLTEIQDVHIEACYHGMQVDHIIPLRSKTVCGLHTVDNLQLLTAEANARKGNRYSHDWGNDHEFYNPKTVR